MKTYNTAGTTDRSIDSLWLITVAGIAYCDLLLTPAIEYHNEILVLWAQALDNFKQYEVVTMVDVCGPKCQCNCGMCKCCIRRSVPTDVETGKLELDNSSPNSNHQKLIHMLDGINARLNKVECLINTVIDVLPSHIMNIQDPSQTQEAILN